MAKQIDLRRHTENDGDELTEAGVTAAVAIGRRLTGGYRLVVSSGAQRATQAAACMMAGLGERVPGGVVVEVGLRSTREDEWRAAYRQAGSGRLDALDHAAPELVAEDSAVLAAGLRRVFDRLPDGERALAVGHSPTIEAAVLGLTGEVIPPLGKGEGVAVTEDEAGYRVTHPAPDV